MQGLSPLDVGRGLTLVWELGCTFLEEEIITWLHTSPTIRKLKGSVSLNFQQTKQRYQFLWSHDGQNPGEIQELLKSAAQCHVETDSKWPDSSIPGFQQEVATLEAF